MPVPRTKSSGQRPSPDSRRPNSVPIARRAMPPNIMAIEATIKVLMLPRLAPLHGDPDRDAESDQMPEDHHTATDQR
jgi:hypothetical protein